MYKTITRSKARVLAHLMCDGSVSERYLRYSNQDRELLKSFEKDFSLCYDGVHFIRGIGNSLTSFAQVQNKTVISDLKQYAPTYRSKEATIPRAVRDSPAVIKREFLKACFDDEGSVKLVHASCGEWKRAVSIDSASYVFINELKQLLNEEGIQTNKIREERRGRFVWWNLQITGRTNLQLFKEKIGFSTKNKNRKLGRLLNSYIRLA